jgi:hypothetical protein
MQQRGGGDEITRAKDFVYLLLVVAISKVQVLHAQSK